MRSRVFNFLNLPNCFGIPILSLALFIALASLMALSPSSVHAASPDPDCGHRWSYGTSLISSSRLKRDLSCSTYASSPRAEAICCSLEKELEFTWFGRETLSPGWRMEFRSVARTFCAEKITNKDVDELILLRKSEPSQLSVGAGFLLRILGTKALEVPSELGDYEREEIKNEQHDPLSLFNPASKDYILRGGCH